MIFRVHSVIHHKNYCFYLIISFVKFTGFSQDKVDELVILREKRMFEDIKDAIEKKRDLEIKDMQGATAVSVHGNNVLKIMC